MSTLRDIISDINNQASETYKYTNNLFKFTVDGRPGGIYALTGITLLTIVGMIYTGKDIDKKEQYGGKTRKRKSKKRKNKMQTRSRRH